MRVARPGMSPWLTAGLRGAVAGVALVTLAACSTPQATAPTTPPTAPPALTPDIPVPPASPGEPSPSRVPAAKPALPTTSLTRLLIPSIGVDSQDFITVGLDDQKQLQTPTLQQPRAIAWYRGSPLPGESATCSYDQGCTQPSVLDAHINANGVQGVFARLASLKVDAKIAVTRSDGETAHFVVTRVLIIPKKDFPTGTVYGSTETSLVLITCGPGDLVHTSAGGDYLQQTIVLAKLTAITRKKANK